MHLNITLVMANGTTTSLITAPSFDPLNQVLPKDEAIREITSLEERPWEESHHHVLISHLDMMPLQILSYDTPEIISSPYMTIQTLDLEGNISNLSKALPIDILVKIGIVENIRIGSNHNPEEIASFT